MVVPKNERRYVPTVNQTESARDSIRAPTSTLVAVALLLDILASGVPVIEKLGFVGGKAGYGRVEKEKITNIFPTGT